ncbi:hypothetical protein [Actinacidiphila yeochonensis]|uniref:hypothetical protein n=1 Tax=Actinacidiphila yeochonensis TaxID=89050 RepID=UPI00055C21CD|nr:hypothetical protein [Actinacidiphila yeochonensis]
MNVFRTITTAALGAFAMAAAVPVAAQAADLSSTLTGTALTAADAGQQAGGAASSVLQQSGVGSKMADVNQAVQGGAQVVSAGNQLVNG